MIPGEERYGWMAALLALLFTAGAALVAVIFRECGFG